MPSCVARSLAISLACAFVLLAAACGDEGDAPRLAWRGTMDTLPGGAVMVRNPAVGMWDSASAWRAVEELRIGAADGEGPDVFSDVRDLAVDRAGRIYVLQSTAKRVAVFDDSGRFLRSFGRAGGGPGEFENPIGIQLDPAGRLWVSDPRNARYTLFDSGGRVLASHPRRLRMYGWQWDGRFMADGRLVERDMIDGAPGERAGTAHVRFDPSFTAADTLLPAAAPGGDPNENAFVFRRADGTTYFTIPFRPGPLSVLDPRGFHWSGSSAEYRLVQRTLDGDTVRVVTREFTPVPVAEGDLAEFREEIRDFIGSPGYDESRIPKAKPAFQTVTVASDGHLWVRRHLAHGDGGTAFDVLDPEGRFLGEVRLPAEIAVYGPLLIGRDAIHAVVRDALDVPQVVRWRIVRP